MTHDGALTGLLEALDRRLAAAGGAAGDFRSALKLVRPPPRPPGAATAALPVCRFLDAALAAAVPAELAAPLAALAPALCWVQNPNHRRAPPDPRFLDNYGYAVIAGPAAGAPALAACEAMALGMLLLGPRTHYPRHAHPAEELYVPLHEAQWYQGGGAWTAQPAGMLIHHRPGVPHATRTDDRPLLAIYLWRGEIAVHARIG